MPLKITTYLKEQLYVCIPKEHKLAEYSQLSRAFLGNNKLISLLIK